MTAARVGGHVAVIGVLGRATGAINMQQILRKHLQLRGLLVGSRRHQLDMIRALNVNGIRPMIDRHFPLDRIGDAFRYQETNQHIGKIVLDI
jgi:NADPH:quinone reductase-like Zn-dependent oxidoreductase